MYNRLEFFLLPALHKMPPEIPADSISAAGSESNSLLVKYLNIPLNPAGPFREPAPLMLFGVVRVNSPRGSGGRSVRMAGTLFPVPSLNGQWPSCIFDDTSMGYVGVGGA